MAESAADANLEKVRLIVAKMENPHPMKMALLFGVFLVAMYGLFILWGKASLTGHWLEGSNEFDLSHNPWTDVLYMRENSDENYQAVGYVRNRIVTLGHGGDVRLGMWQKDTITWVGDGSLWEREVEV